jgi:peroxiredoxin/mono/diheme cytochrome c family protein
MTRRLAALALPLAAAALLAGRWVQGDDARPPAPEPKAVDFTLNDPRADAAVALADFKDKKAVVVVFLGTECPVGNAYLPVLAKLHDEYSSKGVQFIGINANRQDAARRVAEHARKYEVPFPVLKDPGNAVADRLGAKRVSEVFVLDGGRKVIYQGRVDDQFGAGVSRAGKPTRRDLAEALDEVLAGKPVSQPATAASGCLINRVAAAKDDGAVTYAKHVSRILQKNCQECHRPGQIGPMPLTGYDDAAAWADNIREVVAAGRMPPWHADPRYGTWTNDRSLSKEDRETLLSWIDQGAPKGDDKDLPPPREFPEGWTIGKPDVVFAMPKAFDVPAEAPDGGVPYKYFTIQTDFSEDRWVERAEAHAGAPAVVHHIVVFVVAKGERFDPEAPGAVLTGTAPGEMPLMLESGFAKKLPAGARLVLQMHYTPNGKAVSDQSSVGLVFAKSPPKHRVFTKPVHNPLFFFRADKIPAGDENYEVAAAYTFRQDAHLLDFMPHMHLRGKDFTYELVRPDGKAETLLSVPHYDFNWQTMYRTAKPIAAPKGSKLRCTAHFDNSAKNPNNPDPTADVYWGDQTWEEMMIGWIDYYVDDAAP